jgi:hypothetical protein
MTPPRRSAAVDVPGGARHRLSPAGIGHAHRRFQLTGGLDKCLGGIGQVAAAYDEFLDFAIPSALTESREGTYDGSHYSETINARIAAALLADNHDPGVDWHRQD